MLAAIVLLASCGDKSAGPGTPAAPEQARAVEAPAAKPPQAAVVSPSADRLPPPAIPPLERKGVRYTQAASGRDVGLDQVGGVLVASAADTGKRLWVLAVYPNPIDPKQEADAQWIFFESMTFDPDGRLRIVNEAGKAYLVDVDTRKVSAAP
ncbi:MAG TPA: hypothetical protein VHP37_17275 [Burkholderiales bacterium]|nr:hypothetical protein [Burkholderiales bacterium]